MVCDALVKCKNLSLPKYFIRMIKFKKIKWSRVLPHVMRT
jgi:hypothetical protein